jgi:hypothetical protein
MAILLARSSTGRAHASKDSGILAARSRDSYREAFELPGDWATVDDWVIDSAATRALKAKADSETVHQDLVHYGRTLEGIFALRHGNVDGAKAALLMSVPEESGSSVASLMPVTTLAELLVERGERDVVLEYVRRCEAIVKDGRFDAWLKRTERANPIVR